MQQPPPPFEDLAVGAAGEEGAMLDEFSGELYDCMAEHGLQHFQAWLVGRGWNTKAKVMKKLATLSPGGLSKRCSAVVSSFIRGWLCCVET